ncbi:MAG: hypothetical protein WD871_07850 [Xanthobacteraceae bacterium]
MDRERRGARARRQLGDLRTAERLTDQAEAGIPNVDVNQWWLIAAPAATPAPIIERLNLDKKAYRFTRGPQPHFYSTLFRGCNSAALCQ